MRTRDNQTLSIVTAEFHLYLRKFSPDRTDTGNLPEFGPNFSEKSKRLRPKGKSGIPIVILWEFTLSPD